MSCGVCERWKVICYCSMPRDTRGAPWQKEPSSNIKTCSENRINNWKAHVMNYFVSFEKGSLHSGSSGPHIWKLYCFDGLQIGVGEFLVSWFIGFLVSWFLSFLVLGFLLCWFLGVLASCFLVYWIWVSWFVCSRLLLSWFPSSIISSIGQMSISCSLTDIDLISKISKNWLDGSSGFVGARLLPNRQFVGFLKFREL